MGEIITKDVSVDEVQHQIANLVSNLQSGRYRFILRQEDKPIAVLLSIDEFEDHLDLSETDTPEVQAALVESEDDYKNGQVGTLNDLHKSLKPLDSQTDA